jgi:hypothetical protein
MTTHLDVAKGTESFVAVAILAILGRTNLAGWSAFPWFTMRTASQFVLWVLSLGWHARAFDTLPLAICPVHLLLHLRPLLQLLSGAV